MKFLDKLGLAVFSIIVLTIAILLCLIGFGWMEPTIFGILISKALVSQTGTYVMIGVSIVLILLAIKCLFFSEITTKDEKDEGILLQNEDGKLLITKDTLETMVDGVVKGFPNIQSSKAQVSIDNENNVMIDVSIDVTEGTIIKDVSSNLQTKIKQVVKESTDLELNSVDVKVRTVEVKVEETKSQEMKQE